MGRPYQLPIAGITPCVIRANESFDTPPAFHQHHSAVTADIRQYSNETIISAHYDKWLIKKLGREIVAGIFYFIGPSKAVPACRQYGGFFKLEKFR